ncbi:hypothetical protein CLV30_12810 [Haloactinopolyspora alba]|uniref:Secreted protein n=1 Tax=Haloactinopolyspora alba TaxID=648780 RepID=A0A2P8DEY0_9ACTN|nr:hypothetical protein [Haloactinopolyspora alba]PSK95758.1 hypothetical protein CLV30_12810 [Haloactinopolyspora alba]
MTEWIVAGAAVVSALAAVAAVAYAHHQRNAAKESAAAAEQSAKEAGRSADAAERMASIEAARHHHERRPEVEVQFDQWITEHVTAELVIKNLSGTTVPSVLVELIDGDPVAGFGDEQPRERSYEVVDLEPGVPHQVPFTSVHIGVWEKAIVPFRVTVSSDGQPWEPWLVDAKLPLPRAKIVTSVPKRVR